MATLRDFRKKLYIPFRLEGFDVVFRLVRGDGACECRLERWSTAAEEWVPDHCVLELALSDKLVPDVLFNRGPWIVTTLFQYGGGSEYECDTWEDAFASVQRTKEIGGVATVELKGGRLWRR